MFFHVSSSFIAVVAFTVLTAAMPDVERRTNPTTTTVTVTTQPSPTPISPKQCTTGKMQCCNSVQSSNDTIPPLPGLLALLQVVIQGVSVPVGITCAPINIIGIGGNSCTQQTVCCENNSFNGVIAVGCTPINVNL